MMSGAASKTKGRQKVPMVKMTRQSNLQVTFSKRRAGLFKKASELCTLCDADVALIVFSPADKAFSFGHPSVDSVVDRYRSGSRPLPPSGSAATVQLMETHHKNATLRDLNMKVTEVANQLEAARKHGEDLTAAMNEEREGRWWQNPVDEMDKEKLEQLSPCLDDLKNKVESHADQVWTAPNLGHLLGPAGLLNPNLPFLPPPPDYNLDDDFEQKNVLGGPLQPPPPPPPPLVPMMNNMNMNMMNNPNMAALMAAGMIMPGYNNNFYGVQFNPFGLRFF